VQSRKKQTATPVLRSGIAGHWVAEDSSLEERGEKREERGLAPGTTLPGVRQRLGAKWVGLNSSSQAETRCIHLRRHRRRRPEHPALHRRWRVLNPGQPNPEPGALPCGIRWRGRLARAGSGWQLAGLLTVLYVVGRGHCPPSCPVLYGVTVTTQGRETGAVHSRFGLKTNPAVLSQSVQRRPLSRCAGAGSSAHPPFLLGQICNPHKGNLDRRLRETWKTARRNPDPGTGRCAGGESTLLDPGTET
jgi:hypothetical protein